jgi:hypothetical protein
MTGEGIATIITSAATLVTALGGVIISLRNGQKVADNTRITQDIHDTVTHGDDKQ